MGLCKGTKRCKHAEDFGIINKKPPQIMRRLPTSNLPVSYSHYFTEISLGSNFYFFFFRKSKIRIPFSYFASIFSAFIFSSKVNDLLNDWDEFFFNKLFVFFFVFFFFSKETVRIFLSTVILKSSFFFPEH